MNNYQATIRIKGRLVNTAVFADDPLHARLIIEYQFGIGSIIKGPSSLNESDLIKPIKPLSPDQQRLATMRQQKDSLTKTINAERDRQKIAKAQQQIRVASAKKYAV